MKKILIFLVVLTSVSFAQKEVKSVKISGSDTIVVISEVDNRGLLNGFETVYKNNVKTLMVSYLDGFQHGDEIWYNPDGTELKRIPYRNGVVHGAIQDFSNGYSEDYFFCGHKEKNRRDFEFWDRL